MHRARAGDLKPDRRQVCVSTDRREGTASNLDKAIAGLLLGHDGKRGVAVVEAHNTELAARVSEVCLNRVGELSIGVDPDLHVQLITDVRRAGGWRQVQRSQRCRRRGSDRSYQPGKACGRHDGHAEDPLAMTGWPAYEAAAREHPHTSTKHGPPPGRCCPAYATGCSRAQSRPQKQVPGIVIVLRRTRDNGCNDAEYYGLRLTPPDIRTWPGYWVRRRANWAATAACRPGRARRPQTRRRTAGSGM